MKAEFRTFRNVIHETAAYRSNTVASFLVILVPVLFLLLFWNSAFESRDAIGGYSREQLFAYYLLIVVLQDVLMITVNFEISTDIRSGRLSTFLLRPFNYLRHCFSVFLAVSFNSLLYTGFIVIPLLAFLKPDFFSPSSCMAIGIAAVILASLIAFLFGSLLGCIAFWIEDVSSLQTGLSVFVPILSGAFLPVSFFPDWFGSILAYLPFRYSLAFPVEVLSSRIAPNVAVNGLLVQLIWVLLGAFLLKLAWRRGQNVYTAYGS
jgi:ABC-2 type transport system permease protein